MPNAGSLVVELALSQAEFKADLGKASSEAEKAAKRIEQAAEKEAAAAVKAAKDKARVVEQESEKAAKRAEQALERNTEKAKEWGRSLLAAGGFVLGFEGIIKAVEAISEKTIEGERSIAALNATLQATGHSAGLTAAKLEELNSSIQEKSIFDDDGIRKAQVALLRYREIQGQTFQEALKLVPDLATAMGSDLPAAAQALGRALTDPETGMKALRAVGIFLSESQKDLARSFIEAGDKAGAQKVVLDELQKSVGGLAEGDTKGLFGATKRLSRAWDDLEKALGKKLLSDNAGDFDIATKAVDLFAHAIEHANFNLKDLLASALGAGPILQGFKLAREILNSSQNVAGRTAVGKIRGLEEAQQAEAERAAAIAKQEELEERAYIRHKALLKRQAQAISGFQQDEINERKSALDVQGTQLSFAYAHQQTTISQFFDRSRELIRQNADEATKELGLLGAAQENILNAPAKDGNGHAFSEDERLAASKKLEQIATQQRKVVLDSRKAELVLQQQQFDAERAFTDEIKQSGIRLLELNNEQERAAEARFRLDNRPKFDFINAARNGGTESEKRLADALAINLNTELEILKARARFNKEAERGGLILDEVGNAQARIAIKVRDGSITELDGLQQLSAANKARLADIQSVIDALQEVAEKTGDPRAVAQIDALRLKMEELAASTHLVADQFQDIFKDSFASALEAATTGTKSMKDILRDLEKSIVSSITKIAANNVAQKLFGSAGPFSGVGGFFADAFGAGASTAGPAAMAAATTATVAPLAALSAAATAAAASLSAVAGTSAASSLISPGFGANGGLDFGGFFAGGGAPPVGKVSIVGENGPELFVPRQSGTIIPNEVLRAKRASRGDVHVTINVPGSTSGASADQIARKTGVAVQRALARN